MVSATGIPNLITKEFLKEDSIVFDVGIYMNEETKIVIGDVDYEDVS